VRLLLGVELKEALSNGRHSDGLMDGNQWHRWGNPLGCPNGLKGCRIFFDGLPNRRAIPSNYLGDFE
jgi:hypothetical protein